MVDKITALNKTSTSQKYVNSLQIVGDLWDKGLELDPVLDRVLLWKKGIELQHLETPSAKHLSSWRRQVVLAERYPTIRRLVTYFCDVKVLFFAIIINVLFMSANYTEVYWRKYSSKAMINWQEYAVCGLQYAQFTRTFVMWHKALV